MTPTTSRLRLERLRPDHAERMVAFHERNREHLRSTSPPRPAGYYGLPFWREAGARQAEPFDTARSVSWLMFLREDDSAVVGTINLNEIIRGPFRACFLGYALDHAQVGRGLMSEGLRPVIDHAFETLRLNRIMANYMPSNVRSGAVLERLGFVREGFSAGYLFIDGAWRDHVMTALRNPRPPLPPEAQTEAQVR